MGKGALRTVRKVMDRCPHCGGRSPKELVEGEKRVRWVALAVWTLCTLGVALFLPFLWYRSGVEAYCEECDRSFAV